MPDAPIAEKGTGLANKALAQRSGTPDFDAVEVKREIDAMNNYEEAEK